MTIDIPSFLICSEDDLVFRLRGTQLMIKKSVMIGHGREFAALWLNICGIEKAVVAKPGDRGKLDIDERITNYFFGGGIEGDHLAPVGASLRDCVCHAAAVFGEAHLPQGGGTVCREGVGVKEYLGLFSLFLPVEDILVL